MATLRLQGGESKESLWTALALYLVANNPAWTAKTARAYVRSFLKGFASKEASMAKLDGFPGSNPAPHSYYPLMTKKKAVSRTKGKPRVDRLEFVADGSPRVDFAATVLKGIIEHRDASTYFGSTGALHAWRTVAREKGWIVDGDEATAAGRKHYAESGLDKLPKTPNRRAYFWDWSVYLPSS